MEDNIHPVVRLLAARMKSHPEEFGYKGNGRWSKFLEDLNRLATPEEKLLLRAAGMDELHELVMDELLNGEARRAEEKRRHEEEIKRIMQHQAVQSQIQQIYGANQYANHLGSLSTGVSNLRLGDETLDAGMLKQIKRKLGL
jgi:hypothetical protein